MKIANIVFFIRGYLGKMGCSKKKGFTLTELIIVMAISSFVIGTSYVAIQSANRLSARQTSQINNQNDTRVIMSYLIKDIQNLSSNVTPQKGEGDTLYIVGTVRYYKVPVGTAGGRNKVNIFREENNKGNLVVAESVLEGEKGLEIINPDSSTPYYVINMTFIDKFNKDNVQSFQISPRKGLALRNVEKVATPVGTVLSNNQVELTTATAGATIYYTLDETEPTESSTPYTEPIIITKDTIVRAIATKEGMLPSDIFTGKYEVNTGKYMINAYPTTLKESAANDGSLVNNILYAELTKDGEEKAGNFDNNISKSDVILKGLPVGMDFTVVRIGSKLLEITLIGKAQAHANINDVNITVIVKNTGFTGNSSHGVDGSSNPVLMDFMDENEQWVGYLAMVGNLTMEGGSTINTPNSSIVIKDNVRSTLNLSNNASIIAKNIYINHDVTLTGGARIGISDDISSSTYINGDIDLSNGAAIFNNVYYTGKVKGNYKDYNKVETIYFPFDAIPSLGEDSWYREKGFTVVNINNPNDYKPETGMKYVRDNFDFPDYKNNQGGVSYSDVILVSKGDINLSNNVKISGVLFAPNGKVSIQGGSTFTGTIVAKRLEVGNNAKIQFQQFDIEDFPF